MILESGLPAGELQFSGCKSRHFSAPLGTLSTLSEGQLEQLNTTNSALPHCPPPHFLTAEGHLQAQAPPSSDHLATSGGQSRLAMLSASSASRPTEHMIAGAHTQISITVL